MISLAVAIYTRDSFFGKTYSSVRLRSCRYLKCNVLVQTLNIHGATKKSLKEWYLYLRVNVGTIASEVVGTSYAKRNVEFFVAHLYPNALSIVDARWHRDWNLLTLLCHTLPATLSTRVANNHSSPVALAASCSHDKWSIRDSFHSSAMTVRTLNWLLIALRSN